MELFIDPNDGESWRKHSAEIAEALTLEILTDIYLQEWNKVINLQIKFLEEEFFNRLSPKRKVQWLKIKLNEEVLEQRRIYGLQGKDAYFRDLQIEWSEKQKAKLQREIRLLEIKPSEGDITQVHIDKAKEVPITEWITFGRNKKAVCLWHTDKVPSLHYYEKQNRVKCFSCQVRKDVIDVVMVLRGVNFIEAVKVLIS